MKAEGRNAGAEWTGLAPAPAPGKPGPGPIPEALLGALSLEVRRRIDGLLAGDYRSTFLGSGTEFSQVRPYAVGDDVRKIDPGATARTGEPHVRVEVAEKVPVLWLVLDTSPSMHFGTARRRKADVAAGATLAFAHLANRGGGRVGILTFGDREPLTVPPRGSRMGVLGLRKVLGREPEASEVGATSVGDGLRRAGRLARRRSVVAVVSDFRGPRDWRVPLLEAASRHEVLAVEIRDPRENELPDVGDLALVDPETGRQLRVDTANRRLRQRFAAEAAREREELARELRRTGAGHVVLSTGEDWLRTLATFLRRRAAHKPIRKGAPA
ncbi:MAG: DUF58 domain-containing protein [Rubrobacteraceae bacterium]